MPEVVTVGTVASDVIKRHEHMRARRVNWDSHWQEVADYVIPRKDNVFFSRVPGEKKGQRLYTSTAERANELLSAHLHGMLTNPSTLWFGLSTGVPELDKDPEVKAWLQAVTRAMIEVMNYSNFQTEVHEVYLDLGSFGTSILRIESDDELGVRYEARPIYEAYIAEDHRGIVDTVSYEYKKTIREIAQEYGIDDFTDDMLRILEQDENHELTVIHLVKPREQFNPRLKTPENKPFGSFHVVKEHGTLLKESGFDDMPYVVPRWTKISSEVYGRSPAMTALPDIKLANEMHKSIIRGAQKSIEPPLLAPDDGVVLPIRSTPGAINYYRAGSRDRIEPMMTGARPDIGESIVASVIERIQEAFYIDQLQTPIVDRQTATEVVQRREEQLRHLGPILGRMHFEFLRPLVNRTFNILADQGIFPPAPAQLEGMALQVQYTSQIARAQKTVEAENFTRVFGLVAPLIETKPEVLDLYDGDAIVRDIHDQYGLPAEYLLPDRAVEGIRQQRQEQMEQQQQLESANQEADIVNKLGTEG